MNFIFLIGRQLIPVSALKSCVGNQCTSRSLVSSLLLMDPATRSSSQTRSSTENSIGISTERATRFGRIKKATSIGIHEVTIWSKTSSVLPCTISSTVFPLYQGQRLDTKDQQIVYRSSNKKSSAYRTHLTSWAKASQCKASPL